MAFDQSTRNRLQKFVNDARNLLTGEFTRQLQATYGLDPKAGSVADVDSLTHLDNRQRQTANILRDTLAHYLATTHGKGEKERTKQVLSRIVREQAFTVLNRLAALRMAEARGFLLETIAKGYNAKGFQLYKQLAGSALGETSEAYRNYLYSVFDEFSLDLAVLFDRHSAQGRLFPRESALLELLDLINHHEIEPLWAEDETIGWIYQYFNSQEERKKMRAESQAPRNSRELAVRNQFFTPRYVVEFLTDNTLGRIWYEMTQGNTSLVDSCRYLVRRPTEVFLTPGELAPEQNEATEKAEALSQEELLKQTVYVPHRAIKDPRCIRMLDPACGSMHFGLYAFDLYERIYEEAWQLESQLGAEGFVREGDLKPLHQTYASFEDYRAEIPRLIIEHNIHGVDIDSRAVQIAGLSLWQRAQRAWQQQGIKPQQRPVVRKSNIVCAEPMPGEKVLLQEFASSLNPPVLGQLLEAIFDKMELAGEAGTLLKIEEEIQSSIHEARDQWQARSGSNSVGDMFQAELDQATPQRKLGFDLSGVDDESFWDGAEQLILDALSNYADKAESNADQKRLFAEDAAKGFAFIDLCRKRFDVMLQNPPFGEAAKQSKAYVKKIYPSSSRDILQAFVERLLGLAASNGVVGTLSARTGFFLGDSKHWRSNVVFNNRLELFADLGLGVLDDALVEVAAYVIGKGDPEGVTTYATRHLSTREKEYALAEDIDRLVNQYGNGSNFVSFQQSLIHYIPDLTFAYWAPHKLLSEYPNRDSFRKIFGRVSVGIQTGDNFRFVRLYWEAPEDVAEEAVRWIPLSKGGEYSPPYDDVHLLLDWLEDGKQLELHPSARFQNVELQFKRGVTYTRRTASAFAPKILPDGCLFSSDAPVWQSEDENILLASIGFMMSRVPQAFIELGVGGGDIATSGSAARRYTSAVIEGVPTVSLRGLIESDVPAKVGVLVNSKLLELTFDETSADFSNLYIYQQGSRLEEIVSEVKAILLDSKLGALQNSYEIDILVCNLFALDPLEEEFVRAEVGVHPLHYTDIPDSDVLSDLIPLSEEDLINEAVKTHGAQRYFTKKSYFVDRRIEVLSHALEASPKEIIETLKSTLTDFETKEVARCILSECVGIAFQRWSKESGSDDLRAPFAPLPNIAPAALQGFADDCSSGRNKPVDVLVSDEGSQFDLCTRIKNEIASIKTAALLEECVNSLGGKDLVNYFTSPNLFFSDHLSRYSKSRRQAPIYWPLQTPSGSYTLWVYYHRLNEQTLYACVNDFVQPKLEKTEQALNALRGKSSRSTQEEKELEKLSDLASELRDFRDELLRLAKFWKPNLNDGVQVTAAPLWKLFQHKAWQKKLKETWEKLEKGDYDWAHLACSIWPERVLEKCHQDRSLAIAHAVEDVFWHEVEVPVKRGKKATGQTKLEWQPKALSDAELNALIQAKIREIGA